MTGSSDLPWGGRDERRFDCAIYSKILRLLRAVKSTMESCSVGRWASSRLGGGTGNPRDASSVTNMSATEKISNRTRRVYKQRRAMEGAVSSGCRRASSMSKCAAGKYFVARALGPARRARENRSTRELCDDGESYGGSAPRRLSAREKSIARSRVPNLRLKYAAFLLCSVASTCMCALCVPQRGSFRQVFTFQRFS